jgi:hypothetical protein
MGADAPVLPLDPFAPDFLGYPYPGHERLREAGPVVWLDRYQCWAMARYAEVRDALVDWQRFCSAAGVGLSNFRTEEPWRPPSLVLEADPPAHGRTRAVLAKALAPPVLAQWRQIFAHEADRLARRCAAQGCFDGVTELAEAFPLHVFGDALGLSAEGRERLLVYGNMVFNGFGPHNELFTQAMARADEIRDWVGAQCDRSALAPGGFGAAIYDAAAAGEITEQEAALLVRSLISAGIDTTVAGLGAALRCFAGHPEMWQALRADPALARPAFEESLRLESPVQIFFRTTTEPVEIAGTRLGANEKVLLFLAAANRDPRKWPEPDRFDIRRRAAGHVAFGAGIHVCVGQALARLEAEAVLTALARHIETIEPAGPAELRPNNTLRTYARMPLKVTPAAGSTAPSTGPD